MKSQTKHLIALAAVLAAALAVYAGLRIWNQEKTEHETADGQLGTLTELGDLTELTYTTASGDTLTFRKEGETWVSGEEPELALLQENIDAMERALCSLEYQRAMEEHDELSGYGLDPAAYTVTGTDTEGTVCTILLGDQIDYDGIYYAMVEGRDTVYVVSGDLPDAIRYDLLELAEMDALPEMTGESVESITLVTAAGELALDKLTEKKQEIEVQETGETDENGDAITEEIVATTEIYHWFLRDGTAIPDGNETLTAVLDELSSLSFSSVCDFRPTQEEKAGYALETVLKVQCADGEQMVLYIGAADEEGADCYAQLEGSDLICRMPVSGVDSLLAMTAEALIAEPAAE